MGKIKKLRQKAKEKIEEKVEEQFEIKKKAEHIFDRRVKKLVRKIAKPFVKRQREKAKHVPKFPIPTKRLTGEPYLRRYHLPENIQRQIDLIQEKRFLRNGAIVGGATFIVGSVGVGTVVLRDNSWMAIAVGTGVTAAAMTTMLYASRREREIRRVYERLTKSLKDTPDTYVKNFLNRHEIVYLDGFGNLVGTTREKYLKRFGYKRMKPREEIEEEGE